MLSFTDREYRDSGGVDIRNEDKTRLEQKIKSLEANVEEMDIRRATLESQKDTLENKLREKEEQLKKKDQEIRELKINQVGFVYIYQHIYIIVL